MKFAFVNQAVLAYSILGAAALKMPTVPLWVVKNQQVHIPEMDNDCSGDVACVEQAFHLRQALNTTTLPKFSASDLESFDNDGFVVKRNLFTNRKLLEHIGQTDMSWMGFLDKRVLYASLNHVPAVRALFQADAIRSLLISLTGGSVPVGHQPIVFHLGKHAKGCDWDCIMSTRDCHQDARPETPRKAPAEINVWIPFSSVKDPLLLVRNSHRQWGSITPACDHTHMEFPRHYNFSCVVEHLGENMVAVPDLELGDAIFFNAAVVHTTIKQAPERIAISLRYKDDYGNSPRYRERSDLM
jgi:hypothetical protein